MKQITSFCINHDILKKGMYISRIDKDIVTYDLRMVIPKGLVFRGRRNPHKTKENLRVCRRWHYDRTNSKDYRIVRAFEP